MPSSPLHARRSRFCDQGSLEFALLVFLEVGPEGCPIMGGVERVHCLEPWPYPCDRARSLCRCSLTRRRTVPRSIDCGTVRCSLQGMRPVRQRLNARRSNRWLAYLTKPSTQPVGHPSAPLAIHSSHWLTRVDPRGVEVSLATCGAIFTRFLRGKYEAALVLGCIACAQLLP